MKAYGKNNSPLFQRNFLSEKKKFIELDSIPSPIVTIAYTTTSINL